MADELTLADLAAEAGIPERTIRFYIARGLLDGPARAGRGAVYTPEHRKRLEKIKRLQGEGRTLTEIAAMLTPPARPRVPEAAPWWQFAISEDVLIWVRADASPWRQKQIRDAIGEIAARLKDNPQSEE
jgi:DNA-binding transcriptional MerR regulator